MSIFKCRWRVLQGVWDHCKFLRGLWWSLRPPLKSSRTSAYGPITTTTPPLQHLKPIAYPEIMTPHQRLQGYSPSRKSRFNSTPTNSQASTSLYNKQSLPRASAYQSQRHSNVDYFTGATLDISAYDSSHPKAQDKAHHSAATSAKLNSQQLDRSSQRRRNSYSSDTTDELSDVSTSILGLRIIHLPRESLGAFLNIASYNTARNVETCGLFLGKPKGDSLFVVTVLLIPKQKGTSDTCNMEEEELVSQITEQRNLITLGWVWYLLYWYHLHNWTLCFTDSYTSFAIMFHVLVGPAHSCWISMYVARIIRNCVCAKVQSAVSESFCLLAHSIRSGKIWHIPPHRSAWTPDNLRLHGQSSFPSSPFRSAIYGRWSWAHPDERSTYWNYRSEDIRRQQNIQSVHPRTYLRPSPRTQKYSSTNAFFLNPNKTSSISSRLKRIGCAKSSGLKNGMYAAAVREWSTVPFIDVTDISTSALMACFSGRGYLGVGWSDFKIALKFECASSQTIMFDELGDAWAKQPRKSWAYPPLLSPVRILIAYRPLHQYLRNKLSLYLWTCDRMQRLHFPPPLPPSVIRRAPSHLEALSPARSTLIILSLVPFPISKSTHLYPLVPGTSLPSSSNMAIFRR